MSAQVQLQPGAVDVYWKKAYESLDDGIRASINLAKTGSKIDILAAVLKAADQKREICIQKQWKVKLPKGEVIIIRDVVEKIAKWVKLFVSVGDVAINYDPMTAALPWAAVRFILQAAINNTQVEGAMVADLEIISRVIARYKEFERIHLSRNSSLRQEIQDGLVRLYADTLRFLAAAVKYFHSSRFTRGIKSVLVPPDSGLMETIVQQEAELLRITGLSDTERLYFLEDFATRLIDHTARVEKSLDEDKHLNLLRWLSSTPFIRHHEALSENRMSNSASWVLNHPEYRDWNSSSASCVLLLHGIPGSGKSHISSAVIDAFLTQAAANPLAAPVAYFYCDDCEYEPERAEADNIMRSILRQLTVTSGSQPMVRDVILSEFDHRSAQSKIDGMDMTKLSVQDCVGLIHDVTTADPAIIIVDALDTVNERDRPALINALADIVEKSSSIVKVFLTCRNNSHIFSLIRDRNPEQQNIPVGTQANFKYIEVNSNDSLQDMQDYVNLALSRAIKDRRLLEVDLSTELSELLVEKLVSGAGEMFQWVNVQLEHLGQLKTEEDIMAVLRRETMATLDDTYLLVLDKIFRSGPKSSEVASRAFMWLLYMREAMPCDAFLGAVSSEGMAADPSRSLEQLVTVCASLVSVDLKCNTFRFSHQSVRDFVRRQDQFSPTVAQEVLATRCLKICIEGPNITSQPDTGSPDALYRYAALYWAYHCSQAMGSNAQHRLHREITSFVYDDPGDVTLSFIGWLDHLQTISKELPDDHPMKVIEDAILNTQSSPLFVASAFGLDDLLHDSMSGIERVDVDQKNNSGHTGLYLASAFGNLSAAATLLAYGADSNARCGKFGNPLQAACFAGHTSLVQLLLQHGASVINPGTFNNALEACFHGNQEETAIVLLNDEKTIQDAEGFQSAVCGAAQAGFLEALEWLNKSILSSQYGSDQTDRMRMKTGRAIQGGQVGTLAAFLRANPSPAASLPDGAMALAVVHGHDRIIDLLASMKIDHEEECTLGSPLRCAALMNRERILRKLLDLGAFVDKCGQHGTALQAASMKGHVRIVKLLLRSGANVNQQGGMYGTALQAAAYHGHLVVVEVLLDAGARVHIEGIAKNAFHSAVEAGHYDIVKLMLDRGFKFEDRPELCLMANEMLPGWQTRSLLRTYSPAAQEDLVTKETYMTSSNPSKQVTQVDGWPDQRITSLLNNQHHSWTGLFFSEQRRREDFKIRQDPKTDHWNHALEASAMSGNVQLLRLLLDHKSSLHISDHEGVRALESAAANGHNEAFVLIYNALSSTLQRNELLAALEEAAINGHDDIVSFGVDRLPLDDYNEDQITALVSLSSCSTTPIAEQLLLIARKNSSDEAMNMILSWGLLEATTRGQNHIITMLLKSGTVFLKYAMEDAFIAACGHGHGSALSSLVQAGGDISIALLTEGLVITASKGYTDLLLTLVEYCSSKGAKATVGRPLIAAAGNGRLDATSNLLGMIPTNEGHNVEITRALTTAAFNGHENCVKLLLVAGADVNALVDEAVSDRGLGSVADKPWSTRPPSAPYRYSLQARSWEMRSNGYAHRSNDQTKDWRLGTTINALQAALLGLEKPYHHEGHYSQLQWKQASTGERERVVTILLDHGADANSLGGCKTYPIILAASCLSETIVRELIKAGADVNISFEGRTALFAACGRELSAASVFRCLFEAGANIQCDGYSSEDLFPQCLTCFVKDGQFRHIENLEYAFTDGPGAVAKILLKLSSSFEVKDQDLECFLQCAAALGDQECVELLLERDVHIGNTGLNAATSSGTYASFDDCYYGTTLQAAARFGHVELVQRLLNAGAEPNVLRGRHQTALRAAVVGGHAAVVKLLLQYGADTHLEFVRDRESFQDRLADPLLNIAVCLGSIDIVSMLISAGADVVANSREYVHPLVLACERGNFEMVETLLNAGAPPTILSRRRDYWSRQLDSAPSPLHAACLLGNVEVICLLLERKADVNIEVDNIGPPLHIAAASGKVQVIHLLLEAAADVDSVSKNQHTALSVAAGMGHLDAVECLLAAQATIYEPGKRKNALVSACDSKSYLTLDILLEVAANSTNGEEAIAEALELVTTRGSVDILESLSNYVNPDIGVFHKACISGASAIVDMLLNKGVPVNGEAADGAQALALAARHLQVSVVKLLLDKGAGINHTHPDFGSPLSAVIYGCVERKLPNGAMPIRGNHQSEDEDDIYTKALWTQTLSPDAGQISQSEELVQLLVTQGAALETEPREFGHTIHLACFLGNVKIINTLLSYGADLHSEAGYFRTSLFAAIHGGHPEAVELLLDKGCPVNLSHPVLGTPLFLACKLYNFRIIRSILNSGADPNLGGPDGSSPMSKILIQKCRLSWLDDNSLDNSDLLKMFLGHPQGLKVCSDDLVEAVRGCNSSWSPLRELLKYDQCISVPEEAVLAFFDKHDYNEDDLGLLLQHTGDLGVTKSMLCKARSPSQIIALLKHKPRCSITAEIIEVERNSNWQLEIMDLLLSHEPLIKPTETMVIRVLDRDIPVGFLQKTPLELLKDMWARNATLQVTREMFEGKSLQSLTATWLLSQAPKGLRITQEMLYSTDGTFCASAEVTQILLHHDRGFEITENMALRMLTYTDQHLMLNVLLEHSPEMPISEAIFLAALGYPWRYAWAQNIKDTLSVLQSYNKKMKFTPRMRRVVDEIVNKNPNQEIREICQGLDESSY